MKIVTSLAFITISLVPFYVIRCRSFEWCAAPIPFTLLEVLIVVTFFTWIFWAASLVRQNKDTISGLTSRLKNPLILTLLVFLFFGSISVFVSSDLQGGLGIWKAYFIEGAMIYLVVSDLSIRRKDYFWVLGALFLSGLLISLASFANFTQKISEIGIEESIKLRISGFYEFSNAVPLYLGPIVGIAVGTIISQRSNVKHRIIFYLALACLISGLGAIFLSHSKGGIVGVLVILSVWFGYAIYKFLSVKFKRYFIYFIYASTILYFLVSAVIFFNVDNLVPRKRTSSDSLINRYCIWQGTRDLLIVKPITGSGLNGFHIDYAQYKTCLKNDYQYPHNILLTFWVEIGLFGMLSYLWLSYVFLVTNKKGRDELLSVGLLSAMVYIFIHGLVDVPFFKNDLSIQFWILAALVTVNLKIR